MGAADVGDEAAMVVIERAVVVVHYAFNLLIEPLLCLCAQAAVSFVMAGDCGCSKKFMLKTSVTLRKFLKLLHDLKRHLICSS